jgi:succinate dehydrogenase flavoprotein subunit
VEKTAREAIAPFERTGESPYQVQHELQETMQDLVGICRREDEMQRAVKALEQFQERAARVGVPGNREYNGGWHTALDLQHLVTVSQMITRAGIERKESRGAHFRDDFPAKNESEGRSNIIVRRSDSGVQVTREPLKEIAPELKQIIEDMK